MQCRLSNFLTWAAVACAFMVMVGCATLFKGSSASVTINSSPSSANVEIKRTDGVVLQQGMTPMTARLNKGKEYAVAISLDGYETQTVPIVKDGIETVAFCNLGSIPFWAVDYVTGSMFKLAPLTINVQLKEVTALDSGSSVLYAFLTIVNEDGTQQYATIKMVPIAIN
ncbi:MAG: PEGA domain-containing protein [Gemmatimonadota bacterium]|nr:PEGA domain-containing protein [Gemmatimonadota bacterium]MDE2832054.1 PEGA domain-containing protein [Gemmatimonadota bacterium]MDE2953176.1 PEGA domain-containing protein [Gemmatimonadota bacterium]